MKKIRMMIARWLYRIVTLLVKYQYHLINFADLLDNGQVDDSIKEDRNEQ